MNGAGIVISPLALDTRPVEARPDRGGYKLRCPACRAWVKSLLIVGRSRLLCWRCREVER